MINWNNVYKLSPEEFSEDPNKYADPKLIYSLGKLRELLDMRMFPSPVSGALARQKGSKTSQHYAVNRLSTASDVFIEGIPFAILTKVLFSNLFTGVGIYLDTRGPDGKPWVMFHLDIRKRYFPFIWIVQKMYDPETGIISDSYLYPQKHPEYWRLMNNECLYKNRLYGA